MELFGAMNSIFAVGSDLVAGSLGVIAYVLEALALYTIAKRRAIKKPWLAWIPMVNVWILGSISDQYHYVTKREVKNKRKSLLGFNIAIFAIVIALLSVAAWLFITMMGSAFVGIYPGMMQLPGLDFLLTSLEQNIAMIAIVLALVFSLAGLTIVAAVVYWMAMYDLYRSCEPASSKLYIVISIVGGLFVQGIHSVLMIFCQNKDLGMPPRKPEHVPVVEFEQEEPWVQE